MSNDARIRGHRQLGSLRPAQTSFVFWGSNFLLPRFPARVMFCASAAGHTPSSYSRDGRPLCVRDKNHLLPCEGRQPTIELRRKDLICLIHSVFKNETIQPSSNFVWRRVSKLLGPCPQMISLENRNRVSVVSKIPFPSLQQGNGIAAVRTCLD